MYFGARVTKTIAFRLGACALLTGWMGITRPAVAQNTPESVDGWQVTLDDQRYIWDVRLVSLVGDTLVVRQADSLVHAPIARIAELRMFQKTVLRVGDEHESAVSALAGVHDRVYDLARLDVAERRRAIEGILSEYVRRPE